MLFEIICSSSSQLYGSKVILGGFSELDKEKIMQTEQVYRNLYQEQEKFQKKSLFRDR